MEVLSENDKLLIKDYLYKQFRATRHIPPLILKRNPEKKLFKLEIEEAHKKMLVNDFDGLEKYLPAAKELIESRKGLFQREIREAANYARVRGKTIQSYEFDENFKPKWVQNLITLEMKNRDYNLSPERTIEIIEKIYPGLLSKEVVAEALNTYNNKLLPTSYSRSSGIKTLNSHNKSHMLLNEMFDEITNYGDNQSSNLNDYNRIPSVINGIKSLNYDNYNMMFAIGSGGTPYSIFPTDPDFKTKFMDKNLVIFVFDRIGPGLGNIKTLFNDYKSSKLSKYLEKYYGINPNEVTIDTVNDHMKILKFSIEDKSVDIIIINSYYISIYKPFLKPIITRASKSLYFDSTHSHSQFLYNDRFLQENFDYYLFAPYASSETINFRLNLPIPSATSPGPPKDTIKFLLNLKKARANRQIIEDMGIRAKKYPFGPSATPDEIKEIEEINGRLLTPEYRDVVHLSQQTNFWNVMSGGQRRTRRQNYMRRQTRRR